MARARQQAEQLEQLLSGAVGDGAERLAALEPELADLAVLAQSVGDNIPLVSPSPAFRAALRTQLLTAPAPAPAPVPGDLSPVERLRRFVEERSADLATTGRAAAAAATGAAVVATGGTVGVAQQSLPGDLLYPVKDATEDLRLAFTSGAAERGRLHLAFAEERISEIESGVDRLGPDLIASTLDRLDDEVLLAADDLIGAFRETADRALVADLRSFTADAGGRLAVLASRVPAEVAGRLDDSVEVLRRVEIQVDVVTGVDCDCEPAASITTPRDSFVVRPGEGPALPTPPCDCTAPVGDAQRPVGEPAPSPRPEPRPEPQPTDEPQPAPTAEERDLVPRLPEPIDPVGDAVEDVVDDLLEQSPVDPVEQLPEPVEGVRRDANDAVGEVSEAIDDVLPAPTGTATVAPAAARVVATPAVAGDVAAASSTPAQRPVSPAAGGAGGPLGTRPGEQG